MKTIIAVILLILVVSVCFTGTPASAPQKHKVHVDVTSDDKTTKTLIESYIKRELRSLGDVEIVDEKDAKWILSLVAIAHTSSGSGNKTGKTSIAVMRLFKNTTAQASIMVAFYDYQDAFEKDLSLEESNSRYPKKREIAKKYGSFPTYDYPHLELIVNIKDNDLQNTCKEIVAEFDVEKLEPIRAAVKKHLR